MAAQQGRVDGASATVTPVFSVDIRTFARPLVRNGHDPIRAACSGRHFESVEV
jgi:hypothetical protein